MLKEDKRSSSSPHSYRRDGSQSPPEAHIPLIEDQVTEAHIPLIEDPSHMIDVIMTPAIPGPQAETDMIDMMIEDKIGMKDIGIENLEITVLDIIDSETVIINLIAQEMAVHIDLMIVHSMDLEMLVPIHNIGPLLDPHPLVFVGVKIIVSHFCGGKKTLTASQKSKG